MNPKRLFVIVPSLLPEGPVKGAVALCNGIVQSLPTTLVFLKTARGDGVHIDNRVDVLNLSSQSSWWGKVSGLRAAIRQAGKPHEVATISYCLSADAVNYFMKGYAQIVSSVRGNLPRNYSYDYGPLGNIAAWLHLLALHRFDRIVAMSKSMESQLRRYGHARVDRIGNFVDENELETHRTVFPKDTGPVKFIFLASLSRRKRPELVISAAEKLLDLGLNFHIDIIGSGPLEQELHNMVSRLDLESNVTFHGQLARPYLKLQESHYLILPSDSEGIPRAGLEALYFGIPCILRDIDANKEFIVQGKNGFLFRDDNDVPDVMAEAISCVRNYYSKVNLLPDQYRQSTNVENYLKIIQA